MSQNVLTYYKCLKETCFPDCWKVSSAVPVFKNVGENKVFEKLVNNRIVLFSDFQYVFRSI